jgi:hypothetical protein
MTPIIIDDNFLSPHEIDEIRKTFYSLPAIFTKFTTDLKNQQPPNDKDKYSNRFMYCSHLGDNNFTNSLSLDILDKFCKKNNVKYSKVLRTRSNTSFLCNEKRSSVPHVDDWLDHLVLLYYVEDSDGDTILYSNKYSHEDDEMIIEHKISPKAGRAVLFDGRTYHSFYYPNMHDTRSVININIAKDKE